METMGVSVLVYIEGGAWRALLTGRAKPLRCPVRKRSPLQRGRNCDEASQPISTKTTDGPGRRLGDSSESLNSTLVGLSGEPSYLDWMGPLVLGEDDSQYCCPLCGEQLRLKTGGTRAMFDFVGANRDIADSIDHALAWQSHDC